jgi:tight adherence protein B
MTWIAQAITINRNVGGKLAEVLDQVGATIRERGQIKGQVQTLSAEGRLSAIVLMVLPIGVTGLLLLTNPGYLAKFTQSLLGYGMLAVAAILLIAGGVWLRKVTTLKF